MKTSVLTQGSEIVETKRVAIGEYHFWEAKQYIESLAKDGWVEIGNHYHSINTTEFTFERRRPINEGEDPAALRVVAGDFIENIRRHNIAGQGEWHTATDASFRALLAAL